MVVAPLYALRPRVVEAQGVVDVSRVSWYTRDKLRGTAMDIPRTRFLITGGTGSLGSALARKWASRHDLTLLSRDPHKQVALRRELPDVQFILADVTDFNAVRMACDGKDFLIHAAALKHVDLGQVYPAEFVRVNVGGTETVLRAWGHAHARDEADNIFAQTLLISTDKAVNPVNLYGATKLVCEHVWRARGGSVLRYGNVVESRGSFLDAWQEEVERGGALSLRAPEPTRFFLTMDRAVALVEEAVEHILMKKSRELSLPITFVPHDLRAFSVWRVAAALGLELKELEHAPLLPGEKQHEVLVGDGEVARRVGKLLSMIVWGHARADPGFCSETAPHISGREVLEAAGWYGEREGG